MDFMHILSQKEAAWNTIFSISERRMGPQNVGSEDFPLSPLSTGLPPLRSLFSSYLTPNTTRLNSAVASRRRCVLGFSLSLCLNCADGFNVCIFVDPERSSSATGVKCGCKSAKRTGSKNVESLETTTTLVTVPEDGDN